MWAYALGLHEEAEEVLERSIEDVRTGAASPTRTYFPLWLATGERSGGSHISGGVSRAATAGLFSGGVVPDFTADDRRARDDRQPAGLVGRRRQRRSGGSFGGGGSGGGGGGGGRRQASDASRARLPGWPSL